MTTSKLIRAHDILKQKGFVLPPFNTQAFQQAVTSFFTQAGVSASLEVFSIRFANYDSTPPSGFHACTSYTSRMRDDLGISRDGWWYDYPLPAFLGSRFGTLGRTSEIGIPYVLVNEPYMSNAVGLLRILGYVVSRRHRQFGLPACTVTLV